MVGSSQNTGALVVVVALFWEGTEEVEKWPALVQLPRRPLCLGGFRSLQTNIHDLPTFSFNVYFFSLGVPMGLKGSRRKPPNHHLDGRKNCLLPKLVATCAMRTRFLSKSKPSAHQGGVTRVKQ